MPPDGWQTVTLRDEVAGRLQTRADAQDCSASDLVAALLDAGAEDREPVTQADLDGLRDDLLAQIPAKTAREVTDQLR